MEYAPVRASLAKPVRCGLTHHERKWYDILALRVLLPFLEAI
jgi:hypothetical protein